MNTSFYYIYKDFANYKKHNEIIFLNPTGKPLEEIDTIIRSHLIDGRWFYASEWKVPDLHFENWDTEEDHFLHEFGSVTETNQAAQSSTTIDEFIETIINANKLF